MVVVVVVHLRPLITEDGYWKGYYANCVCLLRVFFFFFVPIIPIISIAQIPNICIYFTSSHPRSKPNNFFIMFLRSLGSAGS